ncbi:MAG: DNA repair protein RadC [Chlamydiota bacterium]
MAVLAELPEEERPRERLFSHGADVLSLTELLAICLGSGRRGLSALALAEELIASFGGLCRLMEATIEELTAVKGIGKAKAAQLKAVFALAKRRGKRAGAAKYLIRNPDDAHTLVRSYFCEQKKEVAVAIFRDVRGFAFHDEVISIGTLSEVLVHPREVFYLAIRHRAYSLILAHNHPSGDPAPSKQDLEVTKLLGASGRIVGVPLDDHLIVGRTGYVSLWQRGLLSRIKY